MDYRNDSTADGRSPWLPWGIGSWKPMETYGNLSLESRAEGEKTPRAEDVGSLRKYQHALYVPNRCCDMLWNCLPNAPPNREVLWNLLAVFDALPKTKVVVCHTATNQVFKLGICLFEVCKICNISRPLSLSLGSWKCWRLMTQVPRSRVPDAANLEIPKPRTMPKEPVRDKASPWGITILDHPAIGHWNIFKREERRYHASTPAMSHVGQPWDREPLSPRCLSWITFSEMKKISDFHIPLQWVAKWLQSVTSLNDFSKWLLSDLRFSRYHPETRSHTHTHTRSCTHTQYMYIMYVYNIACMYLSM